jgi:hypothetical protein
VKTKNDDEKQVVGNPEYVLTNPQDYRNELLDQIKADFEEAKKHLPGRPVDARAHQPLPARSTSSPSAASASRSALPTGWLSSRRSRKSPPK